MYKVTIKRETSIYNKYMKWHATGIASTGGRFSDYHKTLPEAIRRYESNKELYEIVNIIK